MKIEKKFQLVNTIKQCNYHKYKKQKKLIIVIINKIKV